MYYKTNRLLNLSAIILFSTLLFTSCKSKDSDKEADETTTTTETVVTTNTPADWTTYRESTEKAIAMNEERITTLKEKIKASKTPKLDEFRQKRIDALEERNAHLRTKLTDYKEVNITTASDWDQFKADVQKELDDMEKDIKDLDK